MSPAGSASPRPLPLPLAVAVTAARRRGHARRSPVLAQRLGRASALRAQIVARHPAPRGARPRGPGARPAAGRRGASDRAASPDGRRAVARCSAPRSGSASLGPHGGAVPRRSRPRPSTSTPSGGSTPRSRPRGLLDALVSVARDRGAARRCARSSSCAACSCRRSRPGSARRRAAGRASPRLALRRSSTSTRIRFAVHVRLGLVLGALRLRTGSLWPSVLAHVTLNTLTFLDRAPRRRPEPALHAVSRRSALACLAGRRRRRVAAAAGAAASVDSPAERRLDSPDADSRRGRRSFCALAGARRFGPSAGAAPGRRPGGARHARGAAIRRGLPRGRGDRRLPRRRTERRDVERALRAAGAREARRSRFGAARASLTLDPGTSVPEAVDALRRGCPRSPSPSPTASCARTQAATFKPERPLLPLPVEPHAGERRAHLGHPEGQDRRSRSPCSTPASPTRTTPTRARGRPFRKAPDWGDTRFLPGYDFVNGDAHAERRRVPRHARGLDDRRGHEQRHRAWPGSPSAARSCRSRCSTQNGDGTFFDVAEGIDYAVDVHRGRREAGQGHQPEPGQRGLQPDGEERDRPGRRRRRAGRGRGRQLRARASSSSPPT